MRPIDADALTEFLKCLLPERGMWEIEGDTEKNAVCETVAEAIEMVKNMETIQPEKAQLSQEGTTSDIISKTETVERLRGVIEITVSITDHDGGYIDGIETAISTVSTMPSAQPERKKGKWVKIPGMNEYCSACNRFFPLSDFHGRPFEINYCPHCGAKMKGEQS